MSRRTINRDIEDICRAGIPIITMQGYGGGISIVEGYKIDKSLFTGEELQTIFAGLKGIDSISKTSYLTKLIEKLSSNSRSIIAEEIIIIDLASHYQISLTQKIDTIKKSIWGQQIISFKYCYKKGESERIIEPYRLVFKWSSWYVFGYCLDRKAFRLFKLNRLWGIESCDENYLKREIPNYELDFESYLSEGEIHLKAVFKESEKYRLIEEYGVDCYYVIKNQMLLFEWDFASYENMREWVFSFGDKVHILEPKKLKDDQMRQAENIIEMYNMNRQF